MAVAMRYGSGGGSAGASGSRARLLWKNQSPTSSFAAQGVAVDLTGFTHVIIKTLISTSGTDPAPLQFSDIDDARHWIFIQSATANRTGGRSFTFDLTNNKISFNAATFNGATNNAYAIPAEIWGLVL